jgi:hypothetical protein
MTYMYGNKRTHAKNPVNVYTSNIHPQFVYPFLDLLYIMSVRLIINTLLIFAHLHVQFSAKVSNLILLNKT